MEIGDLEEGVKRHMGYINDQTEKIPIYHYGINDSLVFSTTTDVDGKMAEYNGCYKITDALLFSRLVADSIFDELSLHNIQLSHLDKRAFNLSDLSNLDIKIQRRQVNYFDPDLIDSSSYDSNNIIITEPLFDMYNVPFWKNLNYQNQKEFRITFDVFYSEKNNSENFAMLSMPYLDVNLSKHINELPVELVY